MNNLSANHLKRAHRSNQRVQIWYVALLLVVGIFIVRAFYLQVIRHDYYQHQALNRQLKEYTIPAERGTIMAHDGSEIAPLVLNEKKYTLFADPKFIKNSEEVSQKLAKITGAELAKYKKLIEQPNTRYVVLAKKMPRDQQQAVDGLKLKGVGTREETVRAYPQNSLAAQILGFVDDEGAGKYGLEQALNEQLKGRDGRLRAITDAQGVPLVANKSNIDIAPKKGDSVLLTVDLTMQRQVEDILKQGLDNAKSKSGSVVVMDPNTGAIKAVANFPTYNPAEFSKQEDASVFNNAAFSSPLEPGSVMKPLTMAAALDVGAVQKNTTYYDPSFIKIGDAKVTNIEEDGGAGTRSMADILQLSLNTGATYLLQQMGGGQINEQARTTWHQYMTAHFRFGQKTNVEGYEETGIIPDPKTGDGLAIRYANTSFGQGMTATPLQMASALSAIINGGTYYQPTLVDAYIDSNGKQNDIKPKIVRTGVVNSTTSSALIDMMQYVVDKNNKPADRAGYMVGGKTGTAEIAKPTGGYYDNKFNGTYIGFVGGSRPEYVIVVRVNEPGIAGYAGAKAAGPIFASVSNMLIDNFAITPKN